MSLSSLKPGNTLRVYLEDDPTLGSGERYVIVLRVGPKYITLFYPPYLATVRMKVADWKRQTRWEIVRPWAKGYHNLINSRMVQFDKVQLQYSRNNAELALGLLNTVQVPLSTWTAP